MPSPMRSLNLAGATNFRDLGGYRAGDGRSVRYLVPEAVHDAIVESRVYAEGGVV